MAKFVYTLWPFSFHVLRQRLPPLPERVPLLMALLSQQAHRPLHRSSPRQPPLQVFYVLVLAHDLLLPRLAVERRAQLVLPPHPVLLALKDDLHRLRERAPVRRGLAELLRRARDRLLHPLRVRRLEREVDLERAVARARPRGLRGLREREEVVQEDEQLEEELPPEVRVRDLEVEQLWAREVFREV